jgi:parvulin-like peptidyl-prolyl isomerase
LERVDEMNLKFKGAILAAVVMSMSITGCSLVKVNAETDRKKVIAEVNNEKVLKGELIDTYESQKSYYGITEEIEKDEQYKDTLKEMKLDILENLIYQKLVLQKAKEAGFTVNDQAMEEAKKQFDDMLVQIAAQYKSQDGENKSEDAVYTQKAQDYVKGELDAMGKTQDDYIKLMAEDIMIGQFTDKNTESVQVTDEDIKAYYDKELAAQKESADAIESSGIELYKQPEVIVKHVLIEIPEEKRNEYNTLVSGGKDTEAKALLDEELKKINAQAQEVLDKAKNGEDFEKLIEQYGKDPGMASNPDGYVVKQDGQYMPEFENAAFALQKGEISGLVATSYGYHIIKSYDRVPEKIYALEEKTEVIKKAVEEQKKNDMWESIVEGWKAASSIKKYENRI